MTWQRHYSSLTVFVPALRDRWHITLNLLWQVPTVRGARLKDNLKMAGWDTRFLLQMLSRR